VQKEIEKIVQVDPDLTLNNYPLLKRKLDEKFFSVEEDLSFV